MIAKRVGGQRLLLACGAVTGAIVVSVLTFILTAFADRGVVYGTAALSEVRLADGPGIGANTFLHREPDHAKIRRELHVLRGSGIRLIRQEFNWAEIEPQGPGLHIDSSGHDAWAKYDQIVDIADELGIEILARLDRAPAWATPGFDPTANPSIQAPPTDNTDFAAFAGRLATRYSGRIRFYQIWNEPNLLGEWGGNPPDPSQYLAMLRTVGHAIRTSDHDAKIVLAGLAPTIETGPENLSDLLFLRSLYELGAKGDFDIGSTMSYGLFTGPNDVRVDYQRTNFSRAVLWREIMIEFGDFQTPIWASEYGWMSLPQDWSGEPGIWGNHSTFDQAAWTVGGIRRAREQWPWMPTIVVWASRWPEDPDPRDPTPFFRLMDKDFTPRPHLIALRRAFASNHVAGVGLHQETHRAISYRGPWPRVPSDLASLMFQRQTGVPGSTITLRFEGSDIALLSRRGPAMGRILARVDGQDALADSLPRNSAGEAVIDLYAPTVEPLARIPIATRLPSGRHELELIVQADSNPASAGGLVILDGLIVADSRPMLPWLLMSGLWAATAAVVLWALAPIAVIRKKVARLSMAWMDKTCGPFRSVEIAVGVMAILYTFLPHGDGISGWTMVRILLAVNVGLLAIARLREVSLVAVASIPFVGVVGRTGVIDRPVSEILLVAVVFALIIRVIWSGNPEIMHGRWRFAVGYFVLAGIAAAVFADFPKFALRDFRTVLLEPVAFFVVLVSVLRDRSDVRRLLAALVTGATLLALVALVLAPTGAFVGETVLPRLRGTFGSPNNLGLVLERAVPVALALVFSARTRRTPWMAALLILLVVLLLTWSRGAWLGCLLGVAVASVHFWRRSSVGSKILQMFGGFVLIGFAVLTLGFDRLALFLRIGDGGVASRLSIWDAGWRMIRDHLVFGVGPDNFLSHYRAYMRPDAWREPNISHPHNLLLDAWLSIGLFGLLAFLLAVALFWTTWARSRRLSNGQPDPFAWGIAGAMAAGLAHGLVDHGYFLPELAVYFWVLVAAVVVLRRIRSVDDESLAISGATVSA